MRRAPSKKWKKSLLLLGLGLATTGGCYSSGTGADPDDKRPYFPTGIALSPSGNWLFLANSNFDLAFNAGVVQAFNVEKIATAARACRDAAATLRAKPDDRALATARDAACGANAPSRFIGAAVRIGAFAADLRSLPRTGTDPSAGGRLLLPVRGDASLTTIDFDEAGDQITLRCGPGARPGTFTARCQPGWRLGTDPARSDRGLVLGGEPFGVATSDVLDSKGAPVDTVGAVVHQSTGNVSLFVSAANPGEPPPGRLAHILGNLATGGTGIAALDHVAVFDTVAREERQVPRFLVTNRSQSNVLIVQYFPDPKPERSGFVLSAVVPISPQASGFDTRGVVVDPPEPGETRPTRVFLTNRTPAALVVGQIDPVTQSLSFYENLALPIGPSRLTRTSIDGHTLILAASFDARSIVLYDPDSRRVSNVLRTHRGPYAMAVDPVRKLGFISNFTDSTIQVIELDPTRAGTDDFQRIIFSVGNPSGPER